MKGHTMVTIEEVVKEVRQLTLATLTANFDTQSVTGTPDQWNALYEAAVRLGDAAFTLQNIADVKYNAQG